MTDNDISRMLATLEDIANSLSRLADCIHTQCPTYPEDHD